jgi:hypothetical protein
LVCAQSAYGVVPLHLVNIAEPGVRCQIFGQLPVSELSRGYGRPPLTPSNSVRRLPRQDRAGVASQRIVAPLHSFVCTALYAGMSRTTSVNLPELIS